MPDIQIMDPKELKQLIGDLQTLNISIPQITIFKGGSVGGQMIADAINSYITDVVTSTGSLTWAGLSTAIINIAPLAVLVEGWSRVAMAQQEQSFADHNFERYLSDRAAARATIDDYINKVAILKHIKDSILATKQTYFDLEATIPIPHTYGSPSTRTFIYQAHTQKDTPYKHTVTIYIHHEPRRLDQYITGHHVHTVDEYTILPNNTGLSNEDYLIIANWLKYYLTEEIKNPSLAQAWRYSASQFYSQITNQTHHMLGMMYSNIEASYASLGNFNKIMGLLALRVAQAKEAERVRLAVGRAQAFKEQVQHRPLDLLTYRLLGVKI